MVNNLQMVNRKSRLSDNGYGQRVYSLGYSKHKEFTIWWMVKKRLRSRVSASCGFTIWERVRMFLVRKLNSPKDAKLNFLQNGYLVFSFFFVFDPQKTKFRFFENK